MDCNNFYDWKFHRYHTPYYYAQCRACGRWYHGVDAIRGFTWTLLSSAPEGHESIIPTKEPCTCAARVLKRVFKHGGLGDAITYVYQDYQVQFCGWGKEVRIELGLLFSIVNNTPLSSSAQGEEWFRELVPPHSSNPGMAWRAIEDIVVFRTLGPLVTYLISVAFHANLKGFGQVTFEGYELAAAGLSPDR